MSHIISFPFKNVFKIAQSNYVRFLLNVCPRTGGVFSTQEIYAAESVHVTISAYTVHTVCSNTSFDSLSGGTVYSIAMYTARQLYVGTGYKQNVSPSNRIPVRQAAW